MSDPSPKPSNTSHASEDQNASNGGANNRTDIHFFGDRPLAIALVGILAGVSLWISYTNHESDQAALKSMSDRYAVEMREIEESHRTSVNEFSQWADLTYARELKVDAFLVANGVRTERFGPIPKPPAKR